MKFVLAFFLVAIYSGSCTESSSDSTEKWTNDTKLETDVEFHFAKVSKDDVLNAVGTVAQAGIQGVEKGLNVNITVANKKKGKAHQTRALLEPTTPYKRPVKLLTGEERSTIEAATAGVEGILDWLLPTSVSSNSD